MSSLTIEELACGSTLTTFTLRTVTFDSEYLSEHGQGRSTCDSETEYGIKDQDLGMEYRGSELIT
jgi:hypothetical protein